MSILFRIICYHQHGKIFVLRDKYLGEMYKQQKFSIEHHRLHDTANCPFRTSCPLSAPSRVSIIEYNLAKVGAHREMHHATHVTFVIHRVLLIAIDIHW